MVPHKLSLFVWGGKTIISIRYFCDLPREKEWQHLSFPEKGRVLVNEVRQVTDISDDSQSVQICEKMKFLYASPRSVGIS